MNCSVSGCKNKAVFFVQTKLQHDPADKIKKGTIQYMAECKKHGNSTEELKVKKGTQLYTEKELIEEYGPEITKLTN